MPCALVLVALALVNGSSAQAAEPPDKPGSKAAAAATKAPAPRVTSKRVSFPVDRTKFGEGWQQTIPLKASPGDAYVVWIKDGWLHVKRHNEAGALDWQIMLAKVSGPEPPEISVIDGALVFELAYAGGRYFIRETAYALRCMRQRKNEGQYLPPAEFFADGVKVGGWGNSRDPDPTRSEVMLSDWRDDTWCYIASGAGKEQLDAVVRLNPLSLQSPGYGVQTIVGGYVYYHHGDRWLMDDGELLVASRTLEAHYKADLAREKIREKIRKNLSGGSPPAIDAARWLNSDELPWDKLKGKVVVLDFWGTWCGPCVKKLPEVQKLADKFGDRGLVVIGIHSAEASETCEDFIKKNNISYPIAIDSGKTAETYAVSAWPTVFVIDKTGKVVVGYTNDVPSDETIENLLAN